MYFKIQSHKYNFKKRDKYLYDVEYNYDSNANAHSIIYLYHEIIKRTTTEGNFETQYFTIKKTISEYTTTNGNYMYIQFPNLHVSTLETATITNTKEDEGKLATWVIVVIVVVIVAVIIILIIYCICRRIKMKKAQQTAIATNAAVFAAQNQAAANYAAQNAAYEAAAENAYIAEQNYQAQAYQAQVYQNNNYMTPPGVVSDAGYTSNAVM